MERFVDKDFIPFQVLLRAAEQAPNIDIFQSEMQDASAAWDAWRMEYPSDVATLRAAWTFEDPWEEEEKFGW